MDELLNKCKTAQRGLLSLGAKERSGLLVKIKSAIEKNAAEILRANAEDMKKAAESGMADAMKDRLRLDEKRISEIAKGVEEVAALPDYVGEVIEELNPKSGIKIKKIRVPFGVICAIFESRPNVAADIACLCLKSGNACVLKGGSDALNTNKALVKAMRDAIKSDVDPNVITLITSTDRKTTDELITKKGYIDLLIPRGSKRLIDYITENAKVPYIETGAGNCHLYVHEDADVEKAIKIAINAKCQRPSVCNAIETILVDDKIKEKFLKRLYTEFSALNVTIYGCEKTRGQIDALPATEDDYYREYNDYKVAVKVVDNIDEAIAHINKYSTKHSEAIITENAEAKSKFFQGVDSACVYANASTRFTDGGQFGYGAEIGISTSKLHARGPMGLREMTTYKFVIEGNGEVR